MSDYHDALRQLQQQADKKTASETRGIGRVIIEDRPLQWAIAALVTMVLLSVVP